MKKLIIGTGILFLAAACSVNAQEKSAGINSKHALSVNAGVSIPIMCFASDNINDRDAGFAKPGFILDISYSYRLWPGAGMGASVFYGRNSTNDKVVSSDGSGFRYYGILAGPVVMKNFSGSFTGDLRIQGGISRTFAPRLGAGDARILNNDDAFSFTWSAGMGLRYHLSESAFLSFRADHTQMKPKFNAENAFKSEQHVVLINVEGGIGFKW